MVVAPTPTPTLFPTSRSRPNRTWHSWVLGGIVLVALLLRLWSIDWQLPGVLYHDEIAYVRAATSSAAELEDRPFDYRNPSLLRHLLIAEYRLLPLMGQAQPSEAPGADRGALALRMLLARVTVALLGVASVVLLYLTGVRAFGPRTGLLAAGLLAVNFLHVQLSHFGLNDVPACFFMLAALLCAVGLFERPSGRGFLLAGLFGGLAAATKYNYGIVLVAPIAAWAMQLVYPGGRTRAEPLTAHRRNGHEKAKLARRQLILFGPPLLVLGGLAGVVLGMPEILWSFGEIREGVLRQASIGDRRWPGQPIDPVLALYGKTLLHAFGLPAFLAAAAGLALLLQRRPTLAVVLAAIPTAYLLFMSGKALFFARFALPLLPFVCLFSAYGLVRLWSKVRVPRLRAALAVVACIAALAPPASLSAQLDMLAARVDTRIEAERWVQATIPAGARMAVQVYTLPVTFEGDEMRRAYELTSVYSLTPLQRFEQLACAGHSYFLVSSFHADRQQTVGRPGSPTGYEALAERGRVVATFWPGPNGTRVPFSIDDVGLPFWQVTRYARPGPTVWIYELPPQACR